uniref:Activin_recp domain-containing protein n=1 Tax=Steinernema glaseri TaxID=37863 RepID=A0A1I7YV28_9BILA
MQGVGRLTMPGNQSLGASLNLRMSYPLIVLFFVFAALAVTEGRHHAHHKNRVDEPIVISVDDIESKKSSAKIVPFFETVDDQKEYVSYDEEGKPYMLCASRKLDKKETKRCYLPSDKPVYDMGLACYTLWQGNTVVQDCWVNQMISLTQCQKRRCTAPESPMGIQFCCCFGHECNDNYGIEEH